MPIWLGLSPISILRGQENSPEHPLILQSQSAVAVLQGIGGDLQLSFRAAGEKLATTPGELIRYGEWLPARGGTLILLTDGSLLRADLLELSTEGLKLGDAAGLGRELWNEAALPLTRVRAICFDPPASELARDQLLAQLAVGQTRDRIWLASGETIGGLFLGLDTASPGGEQRMATVRLRPNGAEESLSIPLPKVIAVSFNTALSKTSPPTGKRLAIGFRDGSLIFARAIEDGAPNVRFRLVCGGSLTAPVAMGDGEPREIWEQVEFVQAFGGCTTYLSDLKPLNIKAVPFLTVDWPYRPDLSVLGGRLRKGGGKVALKGLGFHAAGRLVYDIPEKAERFEAELGIDARAGNRGSVQFRVLLQDEDGEWSSRYESSIMRGGEPPMPVSIPLKKYQRIALLVDFADHGDECDYANWFDARFVGSE